MKKLLIILTLTLITATIGISTIATAEQDKNTTTQLEKILKIDEEKQEQTYTKALIDTENESKLKSSKIFDASQSFIQENKESIKYEWDFGDGNKDEGIQVLHSYNKTGYYTVILKLKTDNNEYSTEKEVFIYDNLILLITDKEEIQDRLSALKTSAEKNGTYLHLIETFGSSTEFISEEILTKKLTKESEMIKKADQILVWTKENAGLNALSRYLQNNKNESIKNKTITVIDNNITAISQRIQRQFESISPKEIIIAKESALYPIVKLKTGNIIQKLKEGAYEYEIINEKSGKIRPWNFMGHFVNILINKGIPDNTIALLLLLPFIATVVAIMKQVFGATTYGIYTPTIITLSFLIIGIEAGLLTLATIIFSVMLIKPLLKKIKILYIPKLAIILTVVSLILFLTIIASIYLNLFDAEFLSIAIFPMLILSTLVEKFISGKSGKSTYILMGSTIIVAIIAYFIAGGEINLRFTVLKFKFLKNIVMAYPEMIFLLLFFNLSLGKWTGLRIMERIRFKELLRHIEE